jgi:glycine hydroxymethyltransferase
MINLKPWIEADPETYSYFCREAARQEHQIELIASENYVSSAVLEAVGSILTNKYAEGYPAQRYYGGCQYIDEIERVAIERAKKLFGAEYANVQPYSGSQANQAVFSTFLKPGDTFLALDPAQGGHFTHGAPHNQNGQLYQPIFYGVNENEQIDYDVIRRLALTHQPKMIVGGASSYSLKIDWEQIRTICDEVGAIFFVDMAHYAGLIAAGVYPSPVPFADVISSTTHKTLRGPRGGMILAKAHYSDLLNQAVFPKMQGGPLLHTIAAKAICFKEAQSPEFVAYQQQVLANSLVMASILSQRGYRIVSGRTESHLCVVDLRAKNLTGAQAEALLEQAHMTTNKCAIPNDPLNSTAVNGVRFGTPAMTSRGFKTEQIIEITHCIANVLDQPNHAQTMAQARETVGKLANEHPIYQQQI